jgi:hypothetical protein
MPVQNSEELGVNCVQIAEISVWLAGSMIKSACELKTGLVDLLGEVKV